MKIALCCFAALVTLTGSVSAETAKGGKAVLEMRKDNGPYKNSAYSFRKATGDPAVHRNYVDLLLNKCGFVHAQMVSGQENRIFDLGKSSLKDAADAAPADAKWLTERFKPQAGHVYLEEIKQHEQTMTVKFIVDEVTADKVKLTWVTVKPLDGPDDARRGAAGTKGQCGGLHEGDE
jgi:hypothetical protein